jgi:predicted RNA-binding protein with RPS1 domain
MNVNITSDTGIIPIIEVSDSQERVISIGKDGKIVIHLHDTTDESEHTRKYSERRKLYSRKLSTIYEYFASQAYHTREQFWKNSKKNDI